MVRSRWIGAVAGMLSCVAPVVVAQAPVMQANRVVQVREAGQAPRACRVVHCWKETDGSRICQVEALDNGDKLTVYEPADGSTMRVFKGHAKAPAPVSPRPSGWATRTVVPPVSPAGARPVPGVTNDPPASPTLVKADTTPAKPSNWRESWGTVEGSPSTPPMPRPTEQPDAGLPPLGGGEVPPVPQPSVPPPPVVAELPTAPVPVMPPVTPPVTVEEKPPVPPVEVPPSRPTPPVAKPVGDPLQNPEEFTKTNLPKGVSRVEPPSGMPSLPGVGNPTETPLPPPITTQPVESSRPVKEGGILGLGFRSARPGTGSTTVAANEPPIVTEPLAPPTGRPRPGMASVMAATEEIRPGKKGKPGNMGNAMSLPNSPAGPGIGIPAGAGNAFTPAVTNRPIPGDMGAGPGMVRPQLPGMLPPLPPQPLSPAMQQQMMAAAMAEQQAAMAQMAMMQQHQQMMMAQVAAEQAAQQAATARANQPTVDTQTPKLLASLKDSLLPSEREMAAEGLRNADWKANPQVLAGLTEAAKSDPSPMVRVACIKTLGAIKATAAPVLQMLELLSVDKDVRIRDEAKTVRETLSVKR